MKLLWTESGRADLVRLYEFISPVNPPAADRTVRSLVDAAGRLLIHPRIGEQLDRYQPREVRGPLVGAYEIRYEVRREEIFILRIWHTRESR